MKAFFAGLEIILYVAVALQHAESLAQSNSADDIQSEELDFLPNVRRYNIASCGNILGPDQVYEFLDTLINALLKIGVFSSRVLNVIIVISLQ